MIGVMTGLVIYSPTLYRMFCNLTGYGGTVQRKAAPAPVAVDAAAARTVRVLFDANVAPGLPWEFRPQQREVTARLGEPTRVNYYARNNSDRTVVARATFNVTPYKAAPYFFKIECFCFTEERLGPGESATMPLVLFIDDQIARDADTSEVKEITLSYTFFEQTGLSEEQVRNARDLKAGSEETESRLKEPGKVDFENDAPRQ